ncbi:hypothetical protein [Microbacterium oxydans]|uniref:hypothetical protein n=1 Tax=Microbacterium oxydans TaxID=82380 RepID=UPI0024ADB597|nr:hypothetical protein [Microbacterium oxydans]
MRRRSIVAATMLSVMLLLSAAPAHAALEGDDAVAPEIIAMLEEVPGGVIIDSTHAAWPALGMELSIRSVSARTARSVGSCATDRFCAYSAGSLGGNKLTFSVCSVNTIPSTFIAKSVANARGSGSVQARNGTTTVTTVNAGSWANLAGAVNNLRCVL